MANNHTKNRATEYVAKEGAIEVGDLSVCFGTLLELDLEAYNGMILHEEEVGLSETAPVGVEEFDPAPILEI